MEITPKTYKFTDEEVEAMNVASKAFDEMYRDMNAEDYVVGYDDSEISSVADILKDLYEYLINNCNKVILE